MRTRHRVAVYLAGAAVLAASSYAVATSDAFVRRLVRTALASFLRGPARIRSATFSFREGLVVEGLVALDPADPLGPPAIEVEELRADFGLFLNAEGPRVTTVSLTRPTVRVRRLPDGSLSIGNLLQLPESADGASAQRPEVRIHGGTLVWSDPQLIAGGDVSVASLEATLAAAGDAWRCDVSGRTAELGELRAVAFLAPDGTLTSSVDLPSVPLGPDLLRRLLVPGATEAAEIGVHGALRAHADVRYVRGASASVAAKLDLSGMGASVRFPDHTGRKPERIAIEVARGVAELHDDRVDLTGLEVRVLGGTVRCDAAAFERLGAVGGPTVTGDVTVDGLRVGPELFPYLPVSGRGVLEAYALRGLVSARASLSGRVALPTVSAEATLTDGAVRFDGWVRDDGLRHGFPWEVSGVTGRATVSPDHVLRFEAGGVHGPSRVRADGVIDWRTGDEIPEVTIVADDVPLDADLRAGFQERAEHVFDRWGPSGTAKQIEVKVTRDAHEDGPYGSATQIVLHLDGGATVTPALLPMPLREVTGTIRILYPSRGDHRAERVRFEQVTARGDGVRVDVRGHVDVDDAGGHTMPEARIAEDDLLVAVAVDDLAGPVSQAIRDSTEFIPASVKRALTDFGASGPVDVRAEVAGDPERRRDRVVVALRRASVTGYRDVPFAASDLTGTVTIDGDEARLEDIRATALGSPIRGSGRLIGIASGDVQPDVRVRATGMPLGDPLRRALGPLAEKARAFWDQLHPVGVVGAPGGTAADAEIVLRPSGDETPVELHLRRLRGPIAPLGLQFDVQDGALDFDGAEATLRLDATLGHSDVTLHRAHVDLETGIVEIETDVRQLDFPEDLAPLLGADTVANLDETFRGKSIDATELQIVYDPNAHTLDLTGDMTILREVQGSKPAPGLSPEGTFTIRRLHFVDLPGQPLAFDGVIDAADVRVHPGFQVTRLRGTVGLEGTVGDDGLDLQARTEDASMSVAGFPITHAQIDARTLPAGARMTAKAEFAGGTLTATVGPAGGRYAYRGALHLRNGDLAEIVGRGKDVKGTVSGDVTFENASGEEKDLRGSLDVTVQKGDLVRFGLVSAILNLIPGAGDLTDAQLSGSLEGPVVKVRDLVIRGPILLLSDGHGTVTLDGDLDLALTPSFPPLLRVHVGGNLRKPDVTKRLLSDGLSKDGPAAPLPPPAPKE